MQAPYATFKYKNKCMKITDKNIITSNFKG